MQNILRKKTIYCSEVTVNARIAKMSMILFGDGHSNIKKQDTLGDYVKEKYDIVITNPPYSQKTRYGHLYPIQSENGDAICALHCFESLIYFEKNRRPSNTFFFAVNTVGHELGSRKKAIKENDLQATLDAFNNKKTIQKIESAIVPSSEIIKNGYSLWIYDYFDIFNQLKGDIKRLGDYIEEITTKTEPSQFPTEDFRILGVSNSIGIFDKETLKGEEINQKYKQVKTGNLSYNTHRVNVGS
jgi:type I restriction-modification system DNA methylase subunit